MNIKRYIIPAGIVVSVLVVVILFYCFGGQSLPIDQNDFSGFAVTATSFYPNGIGPDSGFIVTTPHNYSVGEVKKMITISPNVNFFIKQSGECTYLITPNTSLNFDENYVVSFKGYKKSVISKQIPFAVMGKDVAVCSTFPPKNSTNVPRSASIELSFSVPMQDIRDQLVIEPAAAFDLRYVGSKVILYLPSTAENTEFAPKTQYSITVKKGAKGKYAGELLEDYTFSFSTGEDHRNQEPEIALSSGYYYNENARYETFLPDEPPIIDVRNNAYHGRKSYSKYDLYNEDKYKQIGFSVEVFSLPSYNDYLYYIYEMRNSKDYTVQDDYSNQIVDTQNLSSVTSFNTIIDFTAQQIEQQRFASIVFPEPLPAGWYVANCTAHRPDGGKLVMQKLLQISPITYYQQSNDEQALLWFNNGMNGKAVSNCGISFVRNPSTGTQQSSYRTDKDGVLLFDVPPVPKDEPRYSYDGKEPNEFSPLINDYSFYYVLSGVDGILCDAVTTGGRQTKSFFQDYYTYLYTDREIYRQTDELSFWGTICPRSDTITPVKTVTVKLCRNWNSENVIDKQTLTVDEFGVFSGSFKFTDFSSDFYSLFVVPDDVESLYSSIRFDKYISVAQYKTPDYSYTSTTDKKFYGSQDTLKAAFDISFFDGTPMSQVPLTFTAGILQGTGDALPSKVLNTDSNGHIEAQLKLADYIKPNSFFVSENWRPVDMWLNFGNTLAEDYELNATHAISVFPHRTMVTAQSTTKNDKTNLVINTNKIDLTKLVKFEDWYKDDYQNIRGEPIAQDITVTIFHTYYEKLPVGSYIDPYTNLVTPQYRYELRTDEILSLDKNTGATGSITLEDLPTPTLKDGYYADITVHLKDEPALIERYYFGERTNFFAHDRKSSPNGDTPNEKLYNMQVVTDVDNTKKFYNPDYYYQEQFFNVGSNIQVALLENQRSIEMPQNGKFMFNVAQGNILSTTVTEKGASSFIANDSHLPNCSLFGAYFDGRRIYGVAPTSLRLNIDSRSLNIAVHPDKESYLPGETASIKLVVTDPQGAPKPNTSVCASVINEAVFAVEPQEIVFPDNFFMDKFYYNFGIGVSYRQRYTYPNYNNEGGKGGGGDMATGGGIVRRNFSDKAGFAIGKTDKNGVANLKIILPEGLTSWRITALGISKDLYVGNHHENIVTTLPFFVKPIYNKVYLSGDTASLLLRSFGNKVKNGEAIEYQVKLDGTSVYSGEGSVGSQTEAILGYLPVGKHKLSVTGKCGNYSDGIEVDITVVETAMETLLTNWYNLSENIDLKVQKSPVYVTLYNEDYDTYLKAVGIVKAGYTGRADERIAKKAIFQSLKNFYGQYLWIGAEYSDPLYLQDYSAAYGKGENFGIKPFPYSPPSVTMLARAAVTMPEICKDSSIAPKFQYLLSDLIPEDIKSEPNNFIVGNPNIAAALMGMCATNEKLDTITINGHTTCSLLENIISIGNFDTHSKIYAVTAMSYINRDRANQLYEEIIGAKIKTDGDLKYLDAIPENNAVSMTSAAMIPAILLKKTQDSDGFIRYIAEKQTSIYTRGDAALEAAMYVNTFVPRSTGKPVVAFTIDGKEQQVSLDKAAQHSMVLSKDQFETATFSPVSGNAKMLVDYFGSPKDNIAPVEDIIMSRHLESKDSRQGGTTEVTYTINFGPTAKYGNYKLVDWIPNNLRIRKYSLLKDFYCTLDMDNQLLTTYISYNRNSGKTITVTYEAQNILESDAMLDDAYFINTETMEGIWVDGGNTYRWSAK